MSQDQKLAINPAAEKEPADFLAMIEKLNKIEKEIAELVELVKTKQELDQYLNDCLKHPEAMHRGLLCILFEKGRGTVEILVDWMAKRTPQWPLNQRWLQPDVDFFITWLSKLQAKPNFINPELALQLMQNVQTTIKRDLDPLYFWSSKGQDAPPAVLNFVKATEDLVKKFTLSPGTPLTRQIFLEYWQSLHQELMVFFTNFRVPHSNSDFQANFFTRYVGVINLFKGWAPNINMEVNPSHKLGTKDVKEAKLEPATQFVVLASSLGGGSPTTRGVFQGVLPPSQGPSSQEQPTTVVEPEG